MKKEWFYYVGTAVLFCLVFMLLVIGANMAFKKFNTTTIEDKQVNVLFADGKAESIVCEKIVVDESKLIIYTQQKPGLDKDGKAVVIPAEVIVIQLSAVKAYTYLK